MLQEPYRVGNHVAARLGLTVVNLDYVQACLKGVCAQRVPLAAVHVLVLAHRGHAAGMVDLIGHILGHAVSELRPPSEHLVGAGRQGRADPLRARGLSTGLRVRPPVVRGRVRRIPSVRAAVVRAPAAGQHLEVLLGQVVRVVNYALEGRARRVLRRCCGVRVDVERDARLAVRLGHPGHRPPHEVILLAAVPDGRRRSQSDFRVVVHLSGVVGDAGHRARDVHALDRRGLDLERPLDACVLGYCGGGLGDGERDLGLTLRLRNTVHCPFDELIIGIAVREGSRGFQTHRRAIVHLVGIIRSAGRRTRNRHARNRRGLDCERPLLYEHGLDGLVGIHCDCGRGQGRVRHVAVPVVESVPGRGVREERNVLARVVGFGAAGARDTRRSDADCPAVRRRNRPRQRCDRSGTDLEGKFLGVALRRRAGVGHGDGNGENALFLRRSADNACGGIEREPFGQSGDTEERGDIRGDRTRAVARGQGVAAAVALGQADRGREAGMFGTVVELDGAVGVEHELDVYGIAAGVSDGVPTDDDILGRFSDKDIAASVGAEVVPQRGDPDALDEFGVRVAVVA